MRTKSPLLLVGFIRTIAILLAVGRPATGTAEEKPAVLFLGGLHASYAAQPLVQQGIEVDTCTTQQVAERLATRKYNVVVPCVQYDPKLQKVLEDFLAQGGGVFLPLPIGHVGRANDWFPNPEWAKQNGATIRWETLADANPDNVFTDVMGVRLSWSDQVAPPVNQGVRGVLTLNMRTAAWPPLAIDFDDQWTVVVRWAPSVEKTGPPEHDIPRLREYLTTTPLPKAAPLLGIRSVGAGRMALLGIGPQWLLNPPATCPTAEIMMTKGANGKPSDWARVLANTFRWLAEPSLKAGYGGATTPEALLRPQKIWADAPPIDWTKERPSDAIPPMLDQPQIPGLVGARTSLSGGKGTVADYARAARAAGLQFLVFLEDSLAMNPEKFAALVQQCKENSDDNFAAIPGLTFENAQGDHFFTFGDNTEFPKPNLLLKDGRLATVTVSRTEAMFGYIIQALNLRNVVGYWNHKKNFLPVADYKLYNSFPVHSAVDGKPLDSAFDDYLYLMGVGGCQGVLALELMSKPDQVAERAKNGWRVVATIAPEESDGSYPAKQMHPGVKGLREKWSGALGWWAPYQYITQGPEIRCWDAQNFCVIPSGEWYRPDLWQYRARLHVASAAGLRSVTIYDGDRGVFRRWLPGGAKSFEHQMTLSNHQQRDLVLVVEDVNDKRAIGMEIWNRNTLMSHSICGDRCNFLGTARLRRPDGAQFWTPVGFTALMGAAPSKGAVALNYRLEPSHGLTPGSPGLPIDGSPTSWPSPAISFFEATLPGECSELFNYPSVHLVGPDIAMGQANLRLAYDPAEYGAKTTPLGHPYLQPEKQGQIGKNAWTGLYHLIPTKVTEGWIRMSGGNTLDGVRFGWLEAHIVTKQDVPVDPEKGWIVTQCAQGWEIYQGDKLVSGAETKTAAGPFARGTYALKTTPGGAVVLVGTDDRLQYRIDNGALRIGYRPADNRFVKGQAVEFRQMWMGFSGTIAREDILATVRAFGVAQPGQTGYAPKIGRGRRVDDYLIWRTQAQDGAFEARIPRTALSAFVTTVIQGLNDNWSVFLVDRQRAAPNFRPLPIRDGCAWAQLDLTQHDNDLFLGHPIVADNPDVKLLVAWHEPGTWFVEAHNDGDQPLKARLRTNPGWTLFDLTETIELPAGRSRVWRVAAR